VRPSDLPNFQYQPQPSNRIVIPTEAYPDFLLRCTGQSSGAPFCKGKAHEVHRRHQAPQEIRGSEVEGPAVLSSTIRLLMEAPRSPFL
jgi:hypothetical protein